MTVDLQAPEVVTVKTREEKVKNFLADQDICCKSSKTPQKVMMSSRGSICRVEELPVEVWNQLLHDLPPNHQTFVLSNLYENGDGSVAMTMVLQMKSVSHQVQ